ncbi:uncharacterized protein EV420DRAFT_1001763 [Desarmillaria tabescens]|uniref:Uncharacterized protein n=1 Tax=Armillaria tabescens TaxID=1929756 RepID=A0AA39JMQ6_ARMTA|nr:uncharacterized protein EV420DRAFT_1001763 [Desarmillaria tabescens]KAK0444536.1 hypothetical protein EV420DRAFT_1001763 [Desarmillaria tabescens]
MITGKLLHREEASYTSSERRCLVAFYVLQLTGFGGLLIILFTGILSPTVAKRHFACWSFYRMGTSPCTLPNSGHIGIFGSYINSLYHHSARNPRWFLIFFLTWILITVLKVSVALNALVSPPSGVHFNWTPFCRTLPQALQLSSPSPLA